MEDPVREVSSVIYSLCCSKPSKQLATLDKYFTPTASFTHPFCKTGSSRWLISRIYLWYKIMSPKIAIKVHSVSFDEKNLLLYVEITQVFKIWLVPTHKSEVSLVTVLRVTPKDKQGKYYIASQNDLYQTDQFIKFVLPWLAFVMPLLQYMVTFNCVLLSYLFLPIVWLQEHYQIDFSGTEKPPSFSFLE